MGGESGLKTTRGCSTRRGYIFAGAFAWSTKGLYKRSRAKEGGMRKGFLGTADLGVASS